MEVLKCIGCGAVLQTEDAKQIGYVPEIKEKENLFCSNA